MIKCMFSRSGIYRCYQAGRRCYTIAAKNEDSIPTSQEGAAVNDEAPKQPEATNASSPKRDLPVSPFMDDTWLSARQKYCTRKAAPSKEPTELQRKLLRNPYAQALATPVRSCALTNVRLPSYFLQDFELVSHPETQIPWYLPRSLTSKYSSPEDSSKAIEKSSSSLETDNPTSDPSTTAESGARLPDSPARIGPKAYALSRGDILAATVRRGSRFFLGWHKAFPSRRMRTARGFKAESIVWRPDMEMLVLEMMRRRAVEDLLYVAKRGGGYLVGCAWREVEKKKSVGAMLCIPGDAQGPGEFATLDVGERKIAVHNLRLLLGDEKCGEIREKMKVFENEVVVVKGKNNTNKLLLRLWNLQGYLAKYEGFKLGESYRGEVHDLEEEEKAEEAEETEEIEKSDENIRER